MAAPNPNQSDQDNTPVSLPAADEALVTPRWNAANIDRTLWYTIGGIILVSCCGVMLIAYLFTRTSQFKQLTTFPDPVFEYTPPSTPNQQATLTTWTKPPASPIIGSSPEAAHAIKSGDVLGLKSYATYFPSLLDVSRPGDVYFYGIRLDISEPLLWDYGWCTLTADLLDQNFDQMKIEFVVNGSPLLPHFFTIEDSSPEKDWYCRTYSVLITYWPDGIHKLESNITFLEDTDDGWNIYPAGTHTFQYLVTVQP